MKLRLRIALIAGAALAHPALAQDAATTAAGATHPSGVTGTAGTGDDIVVTAQKREQRLLDVPQSVSVISSDLLREVHADRLDDYLTRIPSASINEAQAGQARIILRGINTGGAGATVATYVDETPFGSATSLANGAQLAADLDPSEIDRIEVLRGPQGTLYGANSLGGLVKYVTIAPSTDAVHTFGQVGFEDLAHGGVGWSERFALNVPVTDTLAVRGSGFYRKDAGFIDDRIRGTNVNSDRSYGGRVSALWKPTDRLTLRGTASLQNLDSRDQNTYDADPLTLAPLLGRYQQSRIIAQPSNVKYRIYNGTGTYDFGPVTLLSATSWGNLKQAEVQDATGIYGGVLTSIFGAPLGADIPEIVDQHRFTEEVRLASSHPGFLDWTVGGFYTRERNDIAQTLNGIDGVTGQIFPGLGALELVGLNTKYREIAGFASGTLHFTRQLELTLGGRYSHNKQSSIETLDGPLAGGAQAYPNSSSENVFTFSAAPSWKPTDNITVYGRVARGYRPGGPNVVPPGAPADVPRTFKSDRTTNYEVGVKSELMDHKLSLELTGYWIDWNRIQLLVAVDNYGVNVNGGQARSRGIEFTATLHPLRGLTLSANGAYIDAYLRDDVPGFGAERGDQLPYTAHFAGTLAADYERPLSEKINGSAGVSWRYTGHRESAFDPAYDQRRLGAFGQLDGHAGITYAHFKLDGFVRNITNSHGILDVGAAGSTEDGGVSVAIVRPRSFGATFGFNY